MFRLQDPDVVVPQSEHGRLAGMIALHWGNESFARPPIDFDSFVAGVMLHDWHYGPSDEFPLDDLEPTPRDSQRWRSWLDLAKRGEASTFDDPIAEAVAKRHLVRLLDGEDDPEAIELSHRLDQRVDRLCGFAGIERRDVDAADSIVRVCDRLAFDVFRQSPDRDTIDVCSDFDGARSVTLRYSMSVGSRIVLDQWPLTCDSLQIGLLSFRRETYPRELTPAVLCLSIDRLERPD